MTTVLQAKQALVALGRTTFGDTVRVMFGARVSIDAGVERLLIGDASGTTEPEALGPQRSMVEEYDIDCALSVSWNGDTDQQEAVTARAMALFDTFEHAVRAYPGQNLGVAEIQWASVAGQWTLTEHPASETKGPISTSFEFKVHVRAMFRLT